MFAFSYLSDRRFANAMLMAPEHPMITIFCGFFLKVTPFVDCVLIHKLGTLF